EQAATGEPFCTAWPRTSKPPRRARRLTSVVVACPFPNVPVKEGAMVRGWPAVVILAGMVSFLGCTSATDHTLAGAGKIVLTGSSTVAPLAAEIGKRFEALHPGVRVDVQTGGSSRGIADARQGLADIGMVSRALKPEENDLHAFAIARDGVCIIVHRENPVRTLTDQQVID